AGSLRRHRRPARGHRPESRLAGGAAGAVGAAGSGGPRRCALAAALREAGRRAAARPALAKEERVEIERPPRAQEAADRDRPGRKEGGGTGRARALENALSPDRLPPPARRRPGGRDARALLDVDSRPRGPRTRPGGAAAGPGAARSRLRPVHTLYGGTSRKISASSAG